MFATIAQSSTQAPAGPAPRPLCAYAQRRHLTYPHANGFADGGRSLVLAQRGAAQYELWKHDLASGSEQQLAAWPRALCSGDMLWFDIARERNLLAVVVGNSLWTLDLNQGSPAPRLVYSPPTRDVSSALVPLPSISADGMRVILGQKTGINGHATVELLEISTRDGACRQLARFDWLANHFHLCPADESWIGFCHEGPASLIASRVWAWHAQHEPQGRALFNNAAAGLAVGHERWAFHALCAYVVAYGESREGPRGIYQISLEKNAATPPRLLSGGKRDWHVSPSHCGRWLVIDTSGPHDAPGCGWDGAGDISDVLLVDSATGLRRFLARSRFYHDCHLHPHPVFSPDGRTVFYNEAGGADGGHRVAAVANAWAL